MRHVHFWSPPFSSQLNYPLGLLSQAQNGKKAQELGRRDGDWAAEELALRKQGREQSPVAAVSVATAARRLLMSGMAVFNVWFMIQFWT